MRARQGFDAAFNCLYVIINVLSARQPDDGLNDGKRITGPVINFSRQQDLPLVGLLAVRNIDGDAVDAHNNAGIIDTRSRRTDTPANLATRTQHTEFGLLRARSLRHAAGNFDQRYPIFRVDQRPDVVHRDLEISRVDSEYAVLPFVPTPLLAHQIPIPGSHLTGGKREAATLLGLLEVHVRSLKLGGPFGHMPLKLQIHLLKLAGLAEQFGKYPYLGAQDLGNHRHRNIINRSHLIAAQPIDVGQVNSGYEDDRCFAETRMFANHRGQLEAIQFRHADVD